MINKIHRYIDKMLIRRSIYVLQKYGLICIFTSAVFSQVHAQETRKLTLKQAIELGLQSSHQLKLSKSQIDVAVSRYNQAKDKSLPTGSMGLTYNHAEIPTRKFQFLGTIDIPARADAYLGTVSLQEVIFAGNKLRYAKESTNLLTDIARLDADRDKDDIAYNIIQTCYNLYRLNQSKKVIAQNLQDLDKQIKQAQQFFAQGIVTKNDVLRFQLQRSNIELAGLDLETNSKIVNYNLNILLGLPETTQVVIEEDLAAIHPANPLSEYLSLALENRPELKSFDLQDKIAQNQVKTVQADLKPVFLVGANAYYINPSLNILPEANRFLAPISLAATLSWNFDRLWTNKNKIAEARIQQSQVALHRDLVLDQVKTQVNRDYQNYVQSLAKISILETAIAQATENDRILESKYKNNVASVTDRIDAETQLYQSLINLELAKADAALAYYTLLKSTGTINKSEN